MGQFSTGGVGQFYSGANNVAFNNDNSIVLPLRLVLQLNLRANPDFRERVKVRLAMRRSTRNVRAERTLFGTPALDRMLYVLATRGPMSTAEFFRASMAYHDDFTFRHLAKSGIVALEAGYPAQTVALNDCHRIFEEMRNLVLLMGGAMVRGGAISAPRGEYDLRPLFDARMFERTWLRPRLRSLMALAYAPSGEMDISKIAAVLSESGYCSYRNALRLYHRLGIATRRNWKRFHFYRLNPAWPHHDALLALLRKIVEVWPDERTPIGESNVTDGGQRLALLWDYEPTPERLRG